MEIYTLYPVITAILCHLSYTEKFEHIHSGSLVYNCNHWLLIMQPDTTTDYNYVYSTDTATFTLTTQRAMERGRVLVWCLLALVAGLLSDCYSAKGERGSNLKISTSDTQVIYIQHGTYSLSQALVICCS